MRAQLLHLSGPGRGRTVTYAVPLVTIGSDPTSTCYLRAPQVAARHACIEWNEGGCSFHLRAEDGQVFVNGTEVKEVILKDEDQIEFGVNGPRARYLTYVPDGAVCKPVRRMFADARAVGQVSGRRAATTTLVRDLLTQATPRFKVGFALAVIGGAFLAGWLGGWLGGLPTAEERRRTADMVTQGEVEELRQQQKKQADVLARLSQANATLRRIQQEWSRGVCLIHGVFRLRQPDGNWFSLDGVQPFESEYTGSGFLVSAQGEVVTNRHVVRPWEEIPQLRALLLAGAVPQFARLTATFPGREPIAVIVGSTRLRSDGLDVAVIKVDAEAVEGVPVLPLEAAAEGGASQPGYQRAIVVGYPTGLAALLARADDQLVKRLQAEQASMTRAIEALAAVGQIKPVITQGGVSNVEDRMMTYDAATTHGGSGGPVFGDRGAVIAVNYAIQPGFHGLNYGVPVRFVRELLDK